MNDFNRSIGTNAQTDIGLRNFMLGTYRYMISAMAVSGIVAWFFGNNVLLDANGGLSNIGRTMYSPMVALVFTIAIIFGFGAVGRKLPSMSLASVRVFLYGFAAILGIWLSSIAVFVNPLIAAKVFFMAVAMFAGVSLVGYVTKKDLSGLGKFCLMVFFGMIAFMLLSMFVPSLSLSGGAFTLFNIVGVLVIAGLTAWETQSLKQVYYGTVSNPELAEKYSAFGAASLLISFINMFSFLLNLFGNE